MRFQVTYTLGTVDSRTVEIIQATGASMAKAILLARVPNARIINILQIY